MSIISKKPAQIEPFNAIDVSITPSGTNMIEWESNPKFPIPTGDVVYYIESSRAAGEWFRLNPDTPVTDACVFIDISSYRCGMANDIFYRVVMAVAGEEFFSSPEATLGIWNRRDRLIARDIIRKEYLRLSKYVGTPGFLLKRRITGITCTACVDWDTGSSLTQCCGNCFGTGFENGYYNAIPFLVDLSNSGTRIDANTLVGTNDTKKVRDGCRAVAYPRIDTYDVWVDGNKGKRYVIWDIDGTVEIKGKNLVYAFQMRELPATRSEYDIPLTQPLPTDEDGDTQDPAPTQGGWTTPDITKKIFEY